MAEKSTLARPYAQAVFNLAKADADLQGWSDKLALIDAVVTNESMAEVVTNPDVDKEKVCALIIDVCGDNLDEKGQNFVKLLAENGRLDLTTEIATMYETLRSEEEGSIEAEVISAFPVNKTQEKSIVAALKKRFGRDVTITTSVDESLLGGIIIRAGDLVIDGSAKTQISKLAHTLMS